MTEPKKIYLDTTVTALYDAGIIDRTVLKACQSAKPPLTSAGDILRHFEENGNFTDIPGCRRPGRISNKLIELANNTINQSTPAEERPHVMTRNLTDKLLNQAAFDFLTEQQQNDCLQFRKLYGYLPMFRVLRYYLSREGAARADYVMLMALGLGNPSEPIPTLANIGQLVGLSRERVRQIIQAYRLPEQIQHSALWKHYADHTTYFCDPTSEIFRMVTATELPGLTFAGYATVLERTTMLDNVDDSYLARRGWTKEIRAWVNRLRKLYAMPRSIDNRISLEGLAMGGSLDTRIMLVVLHQIAPALGILTEAPDTIILPKNN